jgi:glycine cleavage system H protein
MIPDDLKYTREHEWARLEGNSVTIGITHFAQEQLGDVTFVELPADGQDANQGDVIGAVESSKAASDIYAPVAGQVSEINDALEEQPELLNQDCYGAGWICKFQVAGDGALEGLLDAAAYEKHVNA